eukprot:scaffold103275_cov21-Tisochrysis_lutea.AAC.1
MSKIQGMAMQTVLRHDTPPAPVLMLAYEPHKLLCYAVSRLPARGIAQVDEAVSVARVCCNHCRKGLGGEEGSHERCSLMTCSKAIKGYARGQHEMMCSSAAIEGVYSVQCVHFKVRRKGQHGVASSFKGPSCPGAHIPINIGSPVQDDACQLACVLALCACAQVNIGSPVQDDASRSIPPEATPTSVKELRARVEAVQHERALEADTKAAGRDDERGSRGSSKEGGGDGSQKVGENGDVDGEDETPQEA